MGVLVPLAQALGVVALAVCGAFLGKWVSPKKWWPAACAAAMLLLAAFGLVRWIPRLQLMPPFGWVTHGRLEFALFAPAVLVALVPLMLRLPHRRQRVLISVLLAIVLGYHSVSPFLMPAVVRPRLAALKTQIDCDGVCRQTTEYTCGPAASVTALRQLGIDAGEAELALLMHTSPTVGTPTDVAASALQQHFGPRGVRCEMRSFTSVDELPRSSPVLAVIKYRLLVDHFVTVLCVDDRHVTVGDPILGKITYPRAVFEDRWRFMGIVLDRESSGAAVNPTLTPAY
ncbi:MAG TPA: cysteine peptidase family C39 domain-containing protein [Tepidisphaeraceae bacterium]|nr:cysteine peptidase family C39 domain-containing protein [Tepidisphaeraceae bacterium]